MRSEAEVRAHIAKVEQDLAEAKQIWQEVTDSWPFIPAHLATVDLQILSGVILSLEERINTLRWVLGEIEA